MQWGIFAVLYLIALPIFVILDFIWLGLISSDFYKLQFGSLLGDTNWIAVGVLYLIMLAGLTYFVIYPASQKGSVVSALLLGAFFGCVLYATYEVTNLALVRDWPLSAALVDIVWGTFLCASVSGLTVFIRNHYAV
jgi:uncharacterized membrane protein